MMDLYDVVYQLIKENDCVIIPEFGGFVCNYFEAKIDLSNQEFYPPVKKIAFNRELKHNDGLLINFLTRKYCIEWKEAENNVVDFVRELNAVLRDKKTLKFENVGEFSVRDNTIVFTPFSNQNLFEGSFGLKRFNFPMLKTGKKGVQIQNKPILSKSKEAKTNKKKRLISPAIFYSSAVAVMVGLIVIAFQFDWIRFEKQELHENANMVPVELFSNSRPSETKNKLITLDNSVTEIVGNPEILNSESVESESIEPKIIKPEILENTINFNAHVIGGSFSNLINANNYKQNLENSGFNSQVLPLNNGMYRVAVKSFSENSAAIAELQSLRNQTGNQSLWVLCN